LWSIYGWRNKIQASGPIVGCWLFYWPRLAALLTGTSDRSMDRIIRDFMRRGVVTCGVDANAAEVARIMLDNDVSALVVNYE